MQFFTHPHRQHRGHFLQESLCNPYLQFLMSWTAVPKAAPSKMLTLEFVIFHCISQNVCSPYKLGILRKPPDKASYCENHTIRTVGEVYPHNLTQYTSNIQILKYCWMVSTAVVFVENWVAEVCFTDQQESLPNKRLVNDPIPRKKHICPATPQSSLTLPNHRRYSGLGNPRIFSPKQQL